MNHRLCIYPGCIENAGFDELGYTVDKILWCSKHWGLFPHECEEAGCDRIVQYNDEPGCFIHSPDEGSSVRGYSAYAKAHGLD